ELPTGSTLLSREQLKAAAFTDMLRAIGEDEPPKPSTRLAQSTETLPAVSAQRQTEPARLTRLVRGELDWIVMKCLEKDRSRRYETASSLALDVERYLADEPVLACPPSAGYWLRKFARRNKGPVLAASLVVFALLAGIVGTTWGMFRADIARDDAANKAEQTRKALGEKEIALAEAKDNLYQAFVNRAKAERTSGRAGQRFATLNAIRQAGQLRVTPELRTEAMAALVLPGVEVVHEWDGWTEDALNLDFDANFERYVRLDRHGGITYCRRTDGGEESLARLPPQGSPTYTGPFMSPDGRFVTFRGGPAPGTTGADRAYVWALQEPGPARLLVLPVAPSHLSVAYRQDRRQLAIGGNGGLVEVYNLDSGESYRRWELGARPRQLAFRSNDSRLAAAAGNPVRCFAV